MPPLLLLFLFLVAAAATAQDPDLDPDCAGRWIHIRDLPPRFNLELLANCSDYPVFDDFCPYAANHGLGQKTHSSSRSWFRTDPLMMELVFHRRMLEYPCLTPDPSLAAAVYLPYYAGIDALRYLYGPDQNSSHLHGRDLFRHLTTSRPSIWRRRAGRDHFLAMARPAWDFSQSPAADPPIFGTSFLESPNFFNLTALTLESRAYPWQEQAVPYPTSFHPASLAFLRSWQRRVRRTRRSSLMLFAGGGGVSANPNIRRSIRLECAENLTVVTATATAMGYERLCDFVDCSGGICEHDPIRYMRPMLGASFCLQPPGDTPTRRSTFDAVVAGCVPVFFEEMSARRQYTWHLPEAEYSEFSVFIPKEDVVGKGLRIADVLMGIPAAEVRRMRERLIGIMERVIYRKHGSSIGLRSKKDAFDIAVDGVLERINSRIVEVSSAQD